MTDVVQKLWGFCHSLRHDGIDYGDYIEQITYLLFLKMSNERSIDLTAIEMRPILIGTANDKKEEAKSKERKPILVNCSWPTISSKKGMELVDYYTAVLRALGQQKGILGDIFSGAQSRFNKPATLKKLLTTIDETEWTSLDVNVKADAFEGLLERAASEGKKGAGQYFTPRVLIQSIVRCMKPDPRVTRKFKISDPACGTGEFLVAAYEWLLGETRQGADFSRAEAKRIKSETYYGQDLVERPRRLALMNLYLHNLEPHITLGDTIYDPPSMRDLDCILTNPPFGTKGANQVPSREDFNIETSSKQLNFVQHVVSVLRPGGRAAIVLPDNCLFEGKAREVIELLMQDCNLHTVLRLPRGTFTPYSQGVKANVIFLQKGMPTEYVWIFDARSNVPGITKKDRPLSPQHVEEFEKCYGSDPNGQSRRKDLGETGRFRRFSASDIAARDYKLDITWLKDESLESSDDLPDPQDLANEAITELVAIVGDLREIVYLIEHEEGVTA